MPICTYCGKSILLGQNRVTINTRDYHSACAERNREQERQMATDLAAMRAKIAAGVLPRQAEDVPIRFVRYASGGCVGCDETFNSSDVGVQFDGGSGRRFLHPDCYVMWTEACGG